MISRLQKWNYQLVLTLAGTMAVDIVPIKRVDYSEMLRLGFERGLFDHGVSADVPLLLTGAPHWRCQDADWLTSVASSCPNRSIALMGFPADVAVFENELETMTRGTAEPCSGTLDESTHCQMGGRSTEDEPTWAGLTVLNETSNFKSFVERFEGKRFPGSVFGMDFSLPHHCGSQEARSGYTAPPSPEFGLPTDTEMFQQGLVSETPWWKGPEYPGLYIASAGMKTDAHVDYDYSEFWIRQCRGRKKWRFITRTEISSNWEEGMHEWVINGEMSAAGLVSDHVIGGSFPDIFNNTALDDALPAGVAVIEAEINPGDLLWAPMGTIHGAATLEDSVVIGRNYIDSSPAAIRRSLDLWEPTCRRGGLRRLLPLGPGCDEVLEFLTGRSVTNDAEIRGTCQLPPTQHVE